MSTRIDDWPLRTAAEFSWDRTYRYTLTRDFIPTNPDGRKVVFIMLNPSTADENIADPTVRRCMMFARDWGYTRLRVLNLFALRSTDPKALYTHHNPVGSWNDYWIQKTTDTVGFGHPPLVVCAWGEHGKLLNRGQEVLELLHDLKVKPHYLRLNASGQPAHPLYLPKNLEPIALV